MFWVPQHQPQGRVLGECDELRSHDFPTFDPSNLSQAEVIEFLSRFLQLVVSACGQTQPTSCKSLSLSERNSHQYGEVVWNTESCSEDSSADVREQNTLTLADLSTSSEAVDCARALQLRNTFEMTDKTPKGTRRSTSAQKQGPDCLRYQSPVPVIQACRRSSGDVPKVFDNNYVENDPDSSMPTVLGEFGDVETQQGMAFTNNVLKGGSFILGNVSDKAAEAMCARSKTMKMQDTVILQPPPSVETRIQAYGSSVNRPPNMPAYLVQDMSAPHPYIGYPPQGQHAPLDCSQMQSMNHPRQMPMQYPYGQSEYTVPHPPHFIPAVQQDYYYVFNNMHYGYGV